MRSFSELREVRSTRDLSRRQRYLILYAVGVVGIILGYAALYNWGMRTLEGDSHSIFRSFQTVVETMTTTGYGADSPWVTPWMNLLVVAMQLSGIAIGFFTLRLLIIPLFERTPLRLENRLALKDDHVVICGYRRDSEVLLDELERLDIDYVLIDDDREEAERLSNDGYDAIDGDPEDPETLRRASIEDAQLAISDAGDRNASVVLTALDLNGDLRVVSLTESDRRNRALREIGVDTAFAPHALVGRRLAHKATAAVSMPEGTSLGEDVTVRELLVRRDSPLHGVAIRETPFYEHPRLTLIAGWFDGDLKLPPAPENRLSPNTVLAVAGPESVIDEVRQDVSGVRSAREHSDVVIAGAGEGGRAAVTALPDGVSTTMIDIHEGEAVDVVGDAGEPKTLLDAGIDDATALIVTVDDDATALMAIALARSLTEELEILARVTDDVKVRTAFSAGADYVLSNQRATARLLAYEVYGEDVVSPIGQIRMVRMEATPFAGQRIEAANAGAATGWVVVGVWRDRQFRTDETLRIDGDDDALVAGTDEEIRTLESEAA